MLHGIVMDVINVPDKVLLISDLMFPIPMLPDGVFAFAHTRG